MKKRRNDSHRASTLQVALSTGLISISALLFAIAAPTNTEKASGQDPSRFQLNEAAAADSITALGNYPDTSAPLSGDTTVTPDAAPTNTTSINVSTSTNFNGRLVGDSATGVVRVTDAHPAGTYTVTVRAFNGGGQTATKTFALTVTTPTTCLPVTFAPATNFGAPLFPAYLAVGDFNGDGKQDLAVSNGGIGPPHIQWGSVYILFGNGAGHFTATNFNSLPFSHPSLVTVGDFNNDGAQDLAMLDEHSVWILLGDGAGNFPASTLLSIGSLGYPSSIAVGDFNGDGKQDLAVPNYASNYVSLLLGNGMGNFGNATNIGVGGPGSVVVGDFNGDGKQDLAIANPSSANVSILLGDGTGNFSTSTSFDAGPGPGSVAVGDFNGDGKQDLATAHRNSGNVSILLGDGTGGFNDATNFGAGNEPSSVAVGDFNGDGKQDLAVGNPPSANVSLLLGDGGGNFGSPIGFDANTGPYSLVVGDFNGDAKQDLAFSNPYSGNVSILLRNCTSAPTPTPTATATVTATATASPTPAITPCANALVFGENFDGVTAPALPAEWSAANAAGAAPLWVTSTVTSNTPPNAAFIDDPATVSDKRLDTPNIAINGQGAQVSFRNFYDLQGSPVPEVGFDGGVLEVSSPNINAGAFTDITDAAVGGSFVTGGYNATISTGFNSPIAGRMAWSGNSGGYITTVANLGQSVVGHFIKLRFRMASDNNGSATGWRVDNVVVTVLCQSPSPSPSPTPTATATATASPTPAITPCANALVFGENFDGVTAPALPAEWSAANAVGAAPLWVTSTVTPNTPPNAAFIDDPATVSDKRLDTPNIAINGQGAQVSFSNFYDLQGSPVPEVGFDGGVLEVSSPNINAGAFTDITDAAVGGSFVAGGYNATISTAFLSPIAGRMAWSGNSGGYITTVANLGQSVVGHFIKLRFRMASDNNGSATGWRVDNIGVTVLCQTPSPTPSATPTATATATATTTPGPSVTPAAQPLNLSARLLVQTGDNVGIGGFIITGTAPKRVTVRGIGPSLSAGGIPNPLADPVLELHGPPGFVTITDDNWRDTNDNCRDIGPAPTNDLEAAICDASLDPGAYTAILRGKNNGTGVGLVEVYDLDPAAPSKLANISTRAFVSTANDIVIAGFILGGNAGDDNVVLRGIGPSLAGAGVPNALANPTLELRGGNGALLLANNNWQDDPAQAAIISAAGLAPANVLESAIAATLPPGSYTVLLAGQNNGTGVGLVEVYDRGVAPSPP